jgi:hypothetical protein
MAAEHVAEFYRSKMLESLNTQDVPEEFKDMVKGQEFDNQYIATFIDANPRILFDVFDSNDIMINITYKPDGEFTWSYMDSHGSEFKNTTVYNFRPEAEKAAVEKAFEILNDKL